jgi:cysteine synthase A
VPKNYHGDVVDDVIGVSDQDAWDTKLALARREGLLLGISAGANVWAAIEVAKRLGPDETVVTVLCDTGERYFSLAEYFQ